MNKLIASSIVGAALSLASLNASAVMIGMTEVGNIDTFVASADLPNSGLGTEVAFINDALDLDLTQDDIFQLQEGTDVDPVCNDDDVCFVDFGADTNYSFFMLKFGVGNSGADTHYLYRNVSLSRYGVYDLGELPDGLRGLSHVTVPVEDIRPPNEVPAPGVLALLGLALTGLAMRRKLAK